MKELGIYVHIPFCMHKCNYCDFISFDNKNQFINKYIEKVKEECKYYLSAQKNIYEVSTIYFGGGTPSYIDSKYIVEILKTIKSEIRNLDNIEITLEVNPGTITEEKLQNYYNEGINRLSIGLQACQNEILKVLGRIHTYEEFIETYNIARKVGFHNINVDLILGIPTQSVSDIEDTTKAIIKLNPEHISVYSLILEEGTKIEEMVKKNELTLPSDILERKMYWSTKEILENAGYIHYEISNFAKRGCESKHNLNCWKQKEYIGIGVAAYSYMENKRYSNTENLEEYLNKKLIMQEKQMHEIQDKESKMKEYMLLGLRKIQGIKISEFKNEFIENPIYLYRETLSKLVIQELLEIDEDTIKLTKKGIDLANLVWEEFV